jgi:hypothetical protein
MPAILSILPLIQTALGVIGSFKGSPQLAKTTGYIQEAVGVVTALTPLVQQFGDGKEVTPEDVRAALEGKDAALARFDELIAAKGG